MKTLLALVFDNLLFYINYSDIYITGLHILPCTKRHCALIKRGMGQGTPFSLYVKNLRCRDGFLKKKMWSPSLLLREQELRL